MKYQFVKKARKAYPVLLLCEVLLVSRSGYYAWRGGNVSTRRKRDEELLPLVKEIHRKSKGTYGARRISKELQSKGIACGRARAKTLMNKAGVSVKKRRKFKATTDSKHNLPVAPNLLNRQFEVPEPNRVWVSDISYIRTAEGWLYLAVILDLFNRRVVGWSMSNSLSRRLVLDSMRMVVYRRRPAPGLVAHSDRGVQYCSDDYRRLLRIHGMKCSMSRKGDCWDNAVAESFFGSLKTERVFWSNYKTREEARRDIFDYIEMFYNCTRRHSSLGYLSPMEYEELWSTEKAA